MDRPDGELDLHGLTRAEALPELEGFLAMAERQQWSKVLIITGQGRNSPSGTPVLRDWLESYLAAHHYSYRRGGQGSGGHGAIEVSL